MKAISDACTFDRNVRSNSTSDKDSVMSHSPGSLHSDESLQITGEVVQQEKKVGLKFSFRAGLYLKS